ncbi:DUF222 domain-containing protein [Aeromicrobium sp. CF3.5]|uniref:HNH endonuclease signature motif containing protein n=1 Tax=Aeromicrobium sp. CF3.5 TaxID=3373078 RepID=UPI003EE47E25
MTTRPELSSLATLCAQAEFAKWQGVLAYRDEQIAALDRGDHSSMYRRMGVNAVALKIAQTLRISEQQVWRIVEQGGRLREHLPSVWAAFGDGVIDAQKASTLAVAVDRLTNPANKQRLDEVVVEYATTHTPSELRRWTDKLIDRLEPVTIDAAEAERAKRHVRLDTGHHGMSYLGVYLSSLAGQAVMTRLHKAAAELPDDGRTLEQKKADLVASWLTNAGGTDCDIHAEVAIIIEAAALAGVTDTPAHTTTGDAPIPPAWIFGLNPDTTLWTRLITDPAGHVLDVTHLGYQPPTALREAAQWRDMTCRISGCNRPATDCDLDHRTAFEAGGETTGTNLDALCRRHHGIKGHGLLPPDAYAPPEVHLVRLPTPDMIIEYVEAA